MNYIDILDNQSKYYNVYFKKKSNGKHRRIIAPNKEYKQLQKELLSYLNFLNLRIHPSSYAWQTNKSSKQCAALHVCKNIVIEMDIVNYFDNISEDHLRNLFNKYDLSSITSYLNMDLDQFIYLLTVPNKYGVRYLPQGFISSPLLANAIRYDIDVELDNYAKMNNMTYSNYGDNLFFSGEKYPQDLVLFVSAKLKQYDFKLNFKKVKYMKYFHEQKILNILINKKIAITKEFKLKLIDDILNCELNDSIIGKINYFRLADNHRDYNYLKNLVRKKHGIHI